MTEDMFRLILNYTEWCTCGTVG